MTPSVEGGRKVLVIDCSVAGISGDMLLGALVDLGASKERIAGLRDVILRHVEGVKELEIEVRDVRRRGFRAKKVTVRAVEEGGEKHGDEVIGAVSRVVDDLGLPDKAREIALSAVKLLIEAEALVHGEEVEEVHLHETGSVDTIVDIVGCVVALSDLGLLDAEVYATPVAVGGGRIRIAHGVLSSPAPATLEILRRSGVYISGGPIDAELTTPTGAALLASIVNKSTPFYPPLRVEKIGYGAGDKDFKEFPNVLRLVVGTRYDALELWMKARD